MLTDPRLSTKDRVRRYLGTDTLPRLENTMADIISLLSGLAAQADELNATQQAAAVNVHNGFQKLEAGVKDLQQQLADAIAKQGTVTPEMQATVDRISESFTTIKKNVETMDDGYEPVEPPVDGGDTPPVADPTPADPNAPVDETPTQDVPVTDEPTGDVPVQAQVKRNR